MATKKKAKKRTAKKRSSRPRVEPPRGFAEYVEEVQVMLDKVEREIATASARTSGEATRLLREASRQLGKVEERGEKSWERLTERARGEALRLIDKLRDAIAPATKPVRRKGSA